jgi:GT2 family glycosyltransferase
MLDYPRDSVQIVAVEGDSEDETLAMLRGWTDTRLHLLKRDTKTPRFPSIESPERFKALSVVGNTALDFVAENLQVDYVLWLESDLIWEPDLLKRLVRHNADAVAPMIWVEIQAHKPVFYDIWGFRNLNGTRFRQIERNAYLNTYRFLFEVSSAGSCLLVKADYIYNFARFDYRAIVGLCQAIREREGRIVVDPLTEVYHPWPL